MAYESHDQGHYEATKQVFRQRALDTQGYYDSQPGGALRHSRWQRRIRRMVLSLLDDHLHNNRRMLKGIDVGCGRGDFSSELALRYPQFAEVWGCDFSQEVLAIASTAAKSFANVFFKEANILDLPFKDKSFDVTLCINVLHHIHTGDLARALAELARITKQFLIVEIKNQQSPYYKRIHARHIYPIGQIRVFPTSCLQVSTCLRNDGFRLRRERGIFLLKGLSPLLVLEFERDG